MSYTRKKSRGKSSSTGSSRSGSSGESRNGRGSSYSSGSSSRGSGSGSSRGSTQDLLDQILGTGPVGYNRTTPPTYNTHTPYTSGSRSGNALNSLAGGGSLYDALFGLIGNGDIDDETWTLINQAIVQQGLTADQRAYDRYLTDDQRKYDWAMLQDSRQYTNPTNELARYMGAGISRDAAIQMMSGSAGNAGSVAGGQPVNSGPVSGPSMNTQGALELEKGLGTANTVMNGLSMLAGICQQGIGMAQGVEQVKAAQMQNYLTDQQIQSYDAVNSVTQALQQLQMSGQLDQSELEKISNVADLNKFLVAQSKSNETIKTLLESQPYQRTFGTTIGRQMFNTHWAQVRDSRDAGTIFDQFVRSQKLDNAVRYMNLEKIGAEMELIGSQKSLTDQQVINAVHDCTRIDAEIYYLNQQGEWQRLQNESYPEVLQSQLDLNASQTRANNSQANLNNANAALLNQQFDYNSAGFPMLKQARIEELSHQLAYWNTINSPTVRQHEVATWILDADNAVSAAYLNQIRLNAAGTFALNNPTLWQLCVGFNAAGVNEFVKTGSEAAGGAAAAGKAVVDIFKAIPK